MMPPSSGVHCDKEQMKRRWEVKLKKVEELALQYERKPLCSVYKPRLSNPQHPSSVWRLFYRQTQAFNFARSCKEDVHVFALERKNKEDGQRIYLVTTYMELWFYYKEHRNNLKCCYEVIPENSVCKLYFDLEFYKPTNPEADGKKMVAKLIEYTIKKLQEIHGIKCSAKDVLNLDSSTNEKFSRHLIFLLQNAAFKDCIHVGNFINTILQPALVLAESKTDMAVQEKGTDNTFSPASKGTLEPNIYPVKDAEEGCPFDTRKTWVPLESSDLSFLIVKDNEGGKKLFVDLGVYTKNRNFRLYKSSKLGKNVFLEIAEDNKFVPKPRKTISLEQQIFLSSLVCNVRYSDSLNVLTFDIAEKEKSACLNHQRCNPSAVTMEGYNFSPYPEIDCFILSLVKEEGVQGGIRRWNYFFLEELLVYDIYNYRWCENIRRAHKSNNIMLLVDLKREVWYQKCHDPVCRAANFKSMCFPLPPNICLSFLFKEENEGCTFMEKARSFEESKIKHSSHHRELPENKSITSFKDSIECSETPSLDKEWINGIEDEYCLEATEDAELVEATENDMLMWDEPEVPDKLLWEALQEYETSENKIYK